MSRRRKASMVETPLAITADLGVLVNALHLGPGSDLDAIVRYAKASGLPIFVGVMVPSKMRPRFAAEMDDLAADIVGRLAPRMMRRSRRQR